MTYVKLKIKGSEKIETIKEIKSVYIQDGYLLIVTKPKDNEEKTDPIDLSLIDYYAIYD